MSDLTIIFMLALLPAIGSVAGALIAEWKQPPEWLIGAALHAAAGIATAVVAVELMPRAVASAATWMLAIAFMGGAIASILLKRATDWARRKLGGRNDRAGLWAVYAAIAADLLIDGLTTGAGAAVSRDLGLLLALSQVAANIPGGFAVAARFRSAGAGRAQRLKLTALYPLSPVFGGAVGYLALRGASDVLTGIALALFSGLLLLATIEDLVPQADQPGAPRKISSPAFGAGFVALMLVASYLGS